MVSMIQVGPTRGNICDRFDRETTILDGSISDYMLAHYDIITVVVVAIAFYYSPMQLLFIIAL